MSRSGQERASVRELPKGRKINHYLTIALEIWHWVIWPRHLFSGWIKSFLWKGRVASVRKLFGNKDTAFTVQPPSLKEPPPTKTPTTIRSGTFDSKSHKMRMHLQRMIERIKISISRVSPFAYPIPFTRDSHSVASANLKNTLPWIHLNHWPLRKSRESRRPCIHWVWAL